jgi:hypothetical protein
MVSILIIQGLFVETIFDKNEASRYPLIAIKAKKTKK